MTDPVATSPARRTARTPATRAPDDYASALKRNLEHLAEPGLGHAYRFGRAAINERRGLIDLVLLHHAALDAALPPNATGALRRQMISAAGEFLAEGVSPFEMAYRGFLEANQALVGVNGTLEREARRVARLLHDGAGQLLFALQLALAELDRELPPRLSPALEEIRGLAHQLDEQLHRHSHELYPVVLEDLGLVPAIRQLLESIDRRAGLSVRFECSLGRRPPADIEFAIYRGVQEALTNVVKHARAKRVIVTLTDRQAALGCVIADDGVGGVAAQPERNGRKGLGLGSIRERMRLVQGTLEIRSRAGEGTEIILTAPWPAGQ